MNLYANSHHYWETTAKTVKTNSLSFDCVGITLSIAFIHSEFIEICTIKIVLIRNARNAVIFLSLRSFLISHFKYRYVCWLSKLQFERLLFLRFFLERFADLCNILLIYLCATLYLRNRHCSERINTYFEESCVT